MSRVTFDTAPQGSDEWLASRRGRITGSMFKVARDKLKSGKLSGRAILYARNVARERFGGKCETVFVTKSMNFGSEQEPLAISAYESVTGSLTREAGFAATDCGMFGVSVDRLVGGDGVVEVKTMVGSDNLFTTVVEEDLGEYMDQCLGYLLFLDRQWVDLALWTPDLEGKGLGIAIHRIERADHLEAIAALDKDLREFAAVVLRFESDLRNKALTNIEVLNQLGEMEAPAAQRAETIDMSTGEILPVTLQLAVEEIDF